MPEDYFEITFIKKRNRLWRVDFFTCYYKLNGGCSLHGKKKSDLQC